MVEGRGRRVFMVHFASGVQPVDAMDHQPCVPCLCSLMCTDRYCYRHGGRAPRLPAANAQQGPCSPSCGQRGNDLQLIKRREVLLNPGDGGFHVVEFEEQPLTLLV
ncbi:MAG: hypothetical protein KatS3mg111_0017 [Pirellulaceae bacterium]|nr:MAG: hypothetical protein KatS3mg111_0017 [Pirellulaceae bacterium]